MDAQTGTAPLAATILGLIGTICWCIQLLPQIWTNFRRKNTEGLPASMMLLWAISGVPFGVYSIIQNLNMPLQVQPAIFTMLALVTWAQCVYYNPPFAWVRRWHVPLFTVTLACTFAGVETALVLTLRPLDSEAKVIAVGVVATVALMSGLVPPYIELAKRRGRVVGINFLFLATDWCGAAFSLMSLVAQRKLDVLGSVMYIAVLVLEAGIFISHLVWRVRFREERREEKRLEKEAKRLKKEEKERAKRAGRDSPVIEGGDLEKAIGLEDA